MKNVSSLTNIIGATPEDDDILYRNLKKKMSMTMDNHGKVYNEGGHYIADAIEVDDGEGIGCC